MTPPSVPILVGQGEPTILALIYQLLLNKGGLAIPAYDYQSISYYSGTNNPETVVYMVGGSGGTVVATVNLTYVNGGASNDDLVSSVTVS